MNYQSNVNYLNKYIKYKTKYINLKIHQFGGNNDDYLENIKFIDNNGVDITFNVKQILKTKMLESFSNNTWANLEQQIENEINKLKEVDDSLKQCATNEADEKWIKCTNTCQTLIGKLFNIEMYSTSYILRTLAGSIISVNGDNSIGPILVINITEMDKINGLFENDNKFIKITKYGNEQRCETCKNGRLIFGYGPSASGKSYWAKSIIKLFNQVNSSFPTSFLSIDGGIYRETCKVYQIIKNLIKKSVLQDSQTLYCQGLVY